MGIKGLWKLIQPSEQHESLASVVAQYGVQDAVGVKGYTLGVDASIWINALVQANTRNFAMAGPSPALRTLFFRLGRLAALPVSVVIVFDGPSRPAVKRGKKVLPREYYLVRHLQDFVKAFGFHIHTALGEAEAELAIMNRAGVVDAVLTDDSDVVIFGALTVIRNPKLKQDKDKVNVYTASAIKAHKEVQLGHHDLILVAILSGGDYSQGLSGCGPSIAQRLARYSLGKPLVDACDLSTSRRPAALSAWRESLRLALRYDPQNHLGRRYNTLAESIPDSFPSADIVRLYTHPVASSMPLADTYAFDTHPPHVDLRKLTRLCERHFGWDTQEILWQFERYVWPALALRILVGSINPGWQRDAAVTARPCVTTYTTLPQVSARDRAKDEHRLVLDTLPLVAKVIRSLAFPPETAPDNVAPGQTSSATVCMPGYIIREIERLRLVAPNRSKSLTTADAPTAAVMHTTTSTAMGPSSLSLLTVPGNSDLHHVNHVREGLVASSSSASAFDGASLNTRLSIGTHDSMNGLMVDLSNSPLSVPRAVVGEVIDLTL